MLYLPNSKIVDSSDVLVAAGAIITAEGQALIRASGAPSSGVTVSGGSSSEIFAGFSIQGVSAAPYPALYLSKVEKFTVPGSGIVQLAQTPVSGQLGVYDTTTSTQVSSPTVVGSTVTGLTAGDIVNVTYQYAATVIQSRSIIGDTQPGGSAGYSVGQTGLIQRGTIFTDQFNAAVNWAAATAIKTQANGQITDQTGSGATITGAYVVQAPTSDVPFLGITFSAA